ncbi:MAG TPA: ATP-binding protein [Mycobacterium sp.]|nr:ATP-binding protein [Mycobacterium sp.]
MSGKEEDRSPLAAAVAGETRDVQRALEVLGQILTGSVTSRATFDGFLNSSFGLHGSDLVCESRWLTAVGHLSAGLAVAALIDKFDPPVGPADDEPPTWGSVVIGDERLAPPSMLAAYFEAGQLAPVPAMVRICDSSGFTETSRIQVFTAPDDRAHATQVLDAIMADADGAKSIFRGRTLAASSANGLTLDPVELPAVTRASVIVPEEVWAEIDLNVASVTVHRELMEQLGLGVRRGVLLAGPPGVGKTVISQVISNELVGEFTVINVDARAGQSALSDVYKEAKTFGPTLIVIEDIDLIVDSRRNRHGAPSILSEFLAAMDAHPMSPLLTLASTNDVSTLDAAAVRSARFDSIIEIGYPSREAAARILSRYLDGVPGADDVEVESVATHFGADMSGADIREVVRRTVLAGSGRVDTADLIATVKSGRFKPQLPDGNYL